jgi:uncharacterized protein (TIRG00374 family)
VPLRKALLVAAATLPGLALLVLAFALAGHGHALAAAALGAALVAATVWAAEAFLVSFDLSCGSLRRGDPGSRTVALTFDDGPGPDTPGALAALDRAGARATFFVLGAKALERPELVREIAARGHAVGLHGFSHRKLHLAGPATIASELDRGREAVRACGVEPVPFFRAPHGLKGPLLGRALRRRGLRLVAWTRGVWDTERPGPPTIVRRATRGLRSGEIVLLHDGCGTPGIDPRRDQTAQAITEIVRAARAAGLEPATIPEMATGASAPEREGSRFGAAQRVSTAGLLLVAVVWAVHDIHWGRLREAVAFARPGLLVLAAGVNFGALFLQAARWHALLRPVSRSLRLRHAFEALLVGFAVSTVVPARAGELARIQWLGRRTGLSRATIVGSVGLDHLVNAAGLVGGLCLLPHLIEVPAWVRPAAITLLALFGAGVTAALLLRPQEAASGEEGAAGNGGEGEAQESRPSGLRAIVARCRRGLAAARDVRALGSSFALSLAAWGIELLVVVVSLEAVGLRLSLSASLLVLLAVNVALALPLTPPGNFGTLELGAVVALMGLGVGKEHALVFAVCYHVLQVVPVGIAGLLLASGRWLFAVPLGSGAQDQER